jgi:hypothetical protein
MVSVIHTVRYAGTEWFWTGHMKQVMHKVRNMGTEWFWIYDVCHSQDVICRY